MVKMILKNDIQDVLYKLSIALVVLGTVVVAVSFAFEKGREYEKAVQCLQEIPRGSEVSLTRTDSIGYVEEVTIQGQNNQCKYKVRVRGSDNMIDYKYKNKSHLQIIEKHK